MSIEEQGIYCLFSMTKIPDRRAVLRRDFVLLCIWTQEKYMSSPALSDLSRDGIHLITQNQEK